MEDLNLNFKFLAGITTDGAPAMSGSQKGLVTLIKKEMESRNINSDNFIISHCMIHQNNLCAQSIRFKNVMSVVVSTINSVKAKGLNSRQFQELLKDVEAEHDNLIYFCEVRWLSRGRMLQRFYEQIEEVKLFLEMKHKPVPAELTDVDWLNDLAFLVDITQHLQELNLKLMGKNQLVNILYSHLKAFEVKLRLFIKHMQEGNTAHFQTLAQHHPDDTKKYAEELISLKTEFESRFQDFRSKEIQITLFSNPFDIDVDTVPNEFQMELIEMQANSELKSKFSLLPLIEFYKTFIDGHTFPNLKQHAIRTMSLFGSTYACEQFFSKMKLAKSNLRTRLTDKNLENQLRVAAFDTKLNINGLASKMKQFHPSH